MAQGTDQWWIDVAQCTDQLRIDVAQGTNQCALVHSLNAVAKVRLL